MSLSPAPDFFEKMADKSSGASTIKQLQTVIEVLHLNIQTMFSKLKRQRCWHRVNLKEGGLRRKEQGSAMRGAWASSSKKESHCLDGKLQNLRPLSCGSQYPMPHQTQSPGL